MCLSTSGRSRCRVANRPMSQRLIFKVLRECPADRASSMLELRPRRRLDSRNAVSAGDSSRHPHCRFRQTVALPSLRQSKCLGDAQACGSAAKGFLICGCFTVKATSAGNRRGLEHCSLSRQTTMRPLVYDCVAFLNMPYVTSEAVEGVQIRQPVSKPFCSAKQLHRRSAF
jgi:hypothetical protein